jgi:hypothetical protein
MANMTMPRVLVAAAVAVTVATAIWLLAFNATVPPADEASCVIQPIRTQSPTSPMPSPPQTPQINVASLGREQVQAEVRRRDALDSKWEWKIPIHFYGKVVDENSQPVLGTDVHFQWTDLSATGTSERDVTSDGQGRFSLGDVEGKRVLVRVTKPGYYSSDPRNRLSFEYANPFEEIYHQPTPDSPVVFHLRKKGIPTQLLRKSVEIFLPGDGSSAKLRLETGKIGSDGELAVQAWKPWPPRPMSPPYDWKVTLTLIGGGFLETHEDFPFEAPETGYQEKYTIDMSAALRNQWKVAADQTLYFVLAEPKRYGHLSIRTDGNSRYIFLEYVINSTGSRNLEFDRTKVIDPR